MFRYGLFDSVICSDRALPELTPLAAVIPAGRSSLEVVFDTAAALSGRLHDVNLVPWQDDSDRVVQGRLGESILIRALELADFVVQPATASVHCHPHPDAHPFAVRHFLLNQILPRLLSVCEPLVIHASAVDTRHGGIALIGPAGFGKSTLAASLAMSGSGKLISDDGILVRRAGPSFRMVGAYPCSRLRSDSADAFGFVEQDIAGDRPPGAKRVVKVMPDQPCLTARPVARAFLRLTQAESGQCDIRMTPLTGFAAVIALIENSFLLDPNDRRLLRSQFEAATDLVQTGCPFYSLTYPRCFAALPQVRAAILSVLGD